MIARLTVLCVACLACGGATSTSSTLPTGGLSTAGVEPAQEAQVRVVLDHEFIAYTLSTFEGRACLIDAGGERRCSENDSAVGWRTGYEEVGAQRLGEGWLLPDGALDLTDDPNWTPAVRSREVTVAEGVSALELGPMRYVSSSPNRIADNVWTTSAFVATEPVAALVAHYGDARPVLLTDQPMLADHPINNPQIVRTDGRSADEIGRTFLFAAYLSEQAQQWRVGYADYLWRRYRWRTGAIDDDAFLAAWLDDFAVHRQQLTGEPHRTSELAGRVLGVCFERLAFADANALPQQIREADEAGELGELETRHAIDADMCLRPFDLRLAMVRYEPSSPEWLLRVRAAPGDPPIVERGGSFFQPGDIIVEVNGRPIAKRDDVAWALRDVDTGDRFTIMVMREGQPRRTWARRPRVRERTAARMLLLPTGPESR